MKTINFIFFLLLLFISCDDNDKLTVIEGTILPSKNAFIIESPFIEEFTETKLLVEEPDNIPYSIKSYPAWIEFSSEKGNVENNSILLNYKLRKEKIEELSSMELGKYILDSIYINFEGKIDDYSYPIMYNTLGNPFIIIYDTDTLDFRKDINQLDFSFGNNSENNSLLNWKIIEYPEWIEVDKKEGALNKSDIEEITLTCKRELLESGIHRGYIVIESNTNIYQKDTIEIKSMRILGESSVDSRYFFKSIKGFLYSKVNDKVYIFTSSPNLLHVFDPNTKTFSKIELLSDTYYKFTISENGEKMFIWYNGLIEQIDLKSYKTIKTINLPNSYLSDIIYDGENYCYLFMGTEFSRVNINTGEIQNIKSYSNIYKGHISGLRKFENLPYLFVELVQLGNWHKHVFDISGVNPKQIVDAPFYNSEGAMWQYKKENKDYFISSIGNIFELGELPEVLKKVDKLNFSFAEPNDSYIHSFNYNENTSILHFNSSSNKIYALDANTYSYLYSIYISELINTEDEENILASSVHIKGNSFYINKRGDQLYSIKTGKIENNTITNFEILNIK